MPRLPSASRHGQGHRAEFRPQWQPGRPAEHLLDAASLLRPDCGVRLQEESAAL